MLPTSSTARLLDLSQLAGNDGRHVSKFVAHTFTAALKTLILQPHFPFEYHHPTTPPGGLTGRNFAVGAPWISLVSKLWLVNYNHQAFSVGSPYERAMKRQEAYNGVLVWNLRGVINTLPVILLISLLLFEIYVL